MLSDVRVSIFCMFLLCWPAFAGQSSGQEISGELSTSYTVPINMPYLVVLPHGYGRRPGPLPVILYLHGGGERGRDLSVLQHVAAVQEAKTRPEYPFILLAPLDPDPEQDWTNTGYKEAVLRILDSVLAKYNGDRDRVYMTGISMGGYATWFFAKSFPHRFAAIAPLAGDPQSRWAPLLTQLPIWIFHGTNDTVVPITDTESMVETLQKLGANPKFTPVVGGDHDIAKSVYSRDDLYRWFLEHKSVASR